MIVVATRLIHMPFATHNNAGDYQHTPENHKNPTKRAKSRKSKVHHRIVSLIKSCGRRPPSHHHLHHGHKALALRWKCGGSVATTAPLAPSDMHLFFSLFSHH